MSMRQKRTYLTLFAASACALLTLLCVLHASDARAQVKATARMMFQREVDTPSPGPTGTVTLSKRNGKQTFRVDVRNLAGESFGLFYGNSLDSNALVRLIATMDRGASNANWSLAYEAVGGAPPQLPVADLDDLSSTFLFIAQPSDASNVVDSVLFAPVPSLLSPITSFNTKTPLLLPPIPPSLTSKGFVRSQFVSAQGRSVFEVRTKGLPGGNQYSVWIADAPGSTNFTDIGTLTSGVFRRDTKKGETLPLSADTVTNLTGHTILIRDAFGDLHLFGQIP